MEALQFAFESRPQRIVFGAGRITEIPDEILRLGCKKALLLSTPEQSELAERVMDLLGERAAGVFDQARQHVPVETVRAAVAHARETGADATLALGGGSTIGLAKAIALELELPILAVPSTYAGSEMTSIWGLTEAQAKRTGRDPRVLPRSVIYDPDLLCTLPASLTGPSGLNAIAHAVEALYAPDANPITSLMAEEAIRAFGEGLARSVEAPRDVVARSATLYGAWLAGTALGMVKMGLHHKLCHTLGGRLDLPHAQTHAIMLPHTAAYNAHGAPQALGRVARALGAEGADQAGGVLFDLLQATCQQTRLSDLGVAEAALEEVAILATQDPYDNPVPVTRDGVLEVLRHAWRGDRPEGAGVSAALVQNPSMEEASS